MFGRIIIIINFIINFPVFRTRSFSNSGFITIEDGKNRSAIFRLIPRIWFCVLLLLLLVFFFLRFLNLENRLASHSIGPFQFHTLYWDILRLWESLLQQFQIFWHFYCTQKLGIRLEINSLSRFLIIKMNPFSNRLYFEYFFAIGSENGILL